MSKVFKAEELRRHYLHRLYELSGGSSHELVPFRQIDADLGISDDEDTKIVTYLKAKGLAHYSTFGHVSITTRGIDEVEAAMRKSYAETERMILRKIYDMSGPNHTEWVIITDLGKDLAMNIHELYDILNDLEHRKGLIGSVDQAVWVKPAGLEFIESGGQSLTGAASNITYTTNIHGPNYGGIQQGGQGNTQSITLTKTNNGDFDKALASIVELVRASDLPVDDKQELECEVATVNKLALREPAPGILERAKSRIDMIKLSLQGTELLIKVGPHLEVAWEYLKHRFSGGIAK